MSNVCAKMFLCQSSSCNTMIQVTLKTTAVCSSETAAPIHDTNCGTHTRHKLRHSYTTQTAAPIHDTNCGTHIRHKLRHPYTTRKDVITQEEWYFVLRNYYISTHVARMGEERGVYRVLLGKPEGRRPLGRPRRRWVDNIRMDLQEVGCGYMDWIGLAQDRDR